MLAEKYFPKGTSRYQALSNTFSKLDGFAALRPERWFAVWSMVLAGANVTHHIEDRWFYWDWSTLTYFLAAIMIFAPWWDKFIQKFSVFPQKIDSAKSGFFIFLTGLILFLLGTIPQGFNHLVFAYGLPYFIFFVVGHLTFSILLKTNANVQQTSPDKKEMVPMLAAIIALTVISAIAGVIHDDPMISTIAAVYSPFPIVALVFPAAVRHIQRCRMYVVFIPAMFLAVRFPWFLVLALLLFWTLRYYHYFRNGVVYPSFKVDHPAGQGK
ncbi:MAG: hypothetical protein U9N31_01190 [Candidatus Marinimicrobia bacterium]|nr:hypothetical protein [Candidatus Neomarinimicrobiota bacterium]